MRHRLGRLALCLPLSLLACKLASPSAPEDAVGEADADAADAGEGWIVDRFADAQVLRYEVPNFETLDLQRKQLLYYLYEAALSGRDITYDQKFAGNLPVRKTLEAILEGWEGEREGAEFQALLTYTKRVWFSNGIHHHYSGRKFEPGFSREWFEASVRSLPLQSLPLRPKQGGGETELESVDELLAYLGPILFDPAVAAKRTNRDEAADPVADSANNFYGEGVTAEEVEAFYAARVDPNDKKPISWGLNSKLVEAADGTLSEQVWYAEGMYGPAIQEIVGWLVKARAVAENDQQRKALELLIAYYQSGDLRQFDAYNIAWVADTESLVDTVNGFIEVYDDAIGYRGTWESVVSFEDPEASERISAISSQAQWFEDNSPLLPAHKKKNVVGVSAKVITVVVEAGDAAPTTPIGINLPNANWIRANHGSKSVNLGNIVEAYDQVAAGDGSLEEFCASPEEVERAKAHGALAHKLHVDMHEVIGHASGQLEEGVGTPKETLKSYASALEEARADLVGLYYVMDPKLVELGLMPSLEVGKAAYDAYIRGGLMVQLSRLELGEQLEESHMRNRQLVAGWAYAQGEAAGVIEKVTKDGKTYFVIRDYDALRELFAQLLREIQRVKSQGDYAAGKALIETYGVAVDPELHAEVLRRYESLDIAPYAGFIQPKLVPQMEGDEIVDVRVEYPTDFAAQMLEYGDRYGFL
ncbi:dihydrofolate reductase [Pseudenhygromyxa sp. WMMC2535]|uniref:dipeptidyl-peptidase 3 family protein n=1 Tax=Pseudenhygromyxa sp. WMMC2535 TaxID=2712867 RepID=UPI001557D5AA|nr:dihydrofolate reductase [Pseudenhygromyxa sp. WMMC2535]NVB38619.1 dihydrofolate reductase [Pseudenhygromyxa sp. WMMC2535]